MEDLSILLLPCTRASIKYYWWVVESFDEKVKCVLWVVIKHFEKFPIIFGGYHGTKEKKA
jgi:hypothetical protein